MKKIVNDELFNEEVKNWWNKNPISYNLDEQIKKPNAFFFEEIDRKVLKWHPWAQDDRRHLSKLVPYDSLKGKKVLDIAIGTGWSTKQFALAGSDVTGIDVAPVAIHLSKLRWQLFNLPKVELLTVDAQKLPFPDDSFDYVLAWGCLMHMPDTQGAINEIYRVLKPKGRVGAMMYNRNSIAWWYHIFLKYGILGGKIFTMDMQSLADRYTDGKKVGGNTLARLYSPKEMKNLYSKFARCSVDIYDNPNGILDSFPHRKLPLGRYLPYRFKLYVSRKFGWLNWIDAVK